MLEVIVVTLTFQRHVTHNLPSPLRFPTPERRYKKNHPRLVTKTLCQLP